MNPPAGYPEYPALLPPGLHNLDSDHLRALCVTQFPRSTTRDPIMSKLDEIIVALEATGMRANLWVDGSFVTQKLDPRDVDVLLHVEDGRGFDATNTAQINAVNWVASNLRHTHFCDSYVNAIPQPAHPLHTPLTSHLQYWQRQFGYSRGNVGKGIVVVPIGGGI